MIILINVLQNLVLQILSGIFGLWLATRFVQGVAFSGDFITLVFAGLILGLINCLIKPFLKLLSTPLILLTLGLFSLLINVAVVWFVDLYFRELVIRGIIPLFWTTAIIWGLGVVFSLTGKGTFRKKKILSE